MFSKKIQPFKLLAITAFMAIAQCLTAQQESYFQQQVNYQIKVELDDVDHILRGHISIEYINNSPDTLSYIWMHLWPNAYKNSQTAFAKQMAENGKLGTYFMPKEERGYIDSLAFSANETTLNWTYHPKHIDIAKVSLNEPLFPQQRITIQTPFKVKLPVTVSRLGHEGQSYQITQWYPKPAVYDQDGWHEMPYLDLGEFYSEFGNFDVEITLAQNYVLGATGELQTESEKAFLEKRIKETKKKNFSEDMVYEDMNLVPPASDAIKKTVRYTAQNVHDFAWFADKRYHVARSKVILASGKEVETYTMFTDEEAWLWKDAIDYVNRGLQFYSEVVGEYPYPKAVAVQGALEAGGGMEYPMITVIGMAFAAKWLDNVIVHEIGHNWFYGILGSNERAHPWMDEGLNSYVEDRYMRKYYEDWEARTNYMTYVYQASRGEEQAINTAAPKNDEINYFLCAYSKPTMVFTYLEKYLGRSQLDSILQQYYETWKFKHPQPADLEKVFVEMCDKPLDWFFDHMINTSKQLDYALTEHQITDTATTIRLKNKGEIAAPVPISAVNRADSIIQTTWIEGLSPKQDSLIQLLPIDGAHYYKIDAAEHAPEVNRRNNLYYTKGVWRKGERPKPQFLANVLYPEKARVNFLPLLGYNRYDGFMIGAMMYNLTIPVRKFQYVFAPMFATGSLSPTGMFEVKHNWIPTHGKKPVQQLTVGLAGRSFTRNDNENYDYQLRYHQLNLYTDIEFRRKSKRDYNRHFLRVDNLLMSEEAPQFSRPDTVTIFGGKANSIRTTHRLDYTYAYQHPITPLVVKTRAEYANYQGFDRREHYVKLQTEGNFQFWYSKLWKVDLRAFAGGFIFHTDRASGDMPLQLVSRNRNDYHYDRYFLGRSEQGNFWEQQIALREGGFKTPIPQATNDGNSNAFIFSLNFKADIPVKFPIRTQFVKIKPYLDFGYFANTARSVTITSPDQSLFFNGGLMIDIWDGAAGIYFPLFGDQKLMRALRGRGNFLQQISFSLDLHRLNPLDLAPKVSLF